MEALWAWQCNSAQGRVESRFDFSPVVVGPPISDQFRHNRQPHSLRRIDLLVGQTRGGEALSQVGQCGFRNVDLERPDTRVSRCDVSFRGSDGFAARAKLGVTGSSEQAKLESC